MASVEVVAGGFQDKWLSCDAVLRVEGLDSRVNLAVFLPPGEGPSASKQITITDSWRALSIAVDRNKPTSISFGPLSEGATFLRVLCDEPEQVKARDARKLGILLLAVNVDGSTANLLGSRHEALVDGSQVPVFPGYWQVHDAFDGDYYRAQVRDRTLVHDPLTHYLAFGWRRGLEPNRLFDSNFYCQQLDGNEGREAAPIVHFATVGRYHGLRTSERAIALRAPEAMHRDSFGEAILIERLAELLHGIGADASFLVNGGPFEYVVQLFDAEVYRSRHALHSKMTFQELFFQYLLFGYPRGEVPGPLFDERHYQGQLEARGLRTEAGSTPFRDWLKRGISLRMSPTPLFDADQYLALNKDLRNYHTWLFDHWILHGLREGRPFDVNLRVATQRAWAEADAGIALKGLDGFARTTARDTACVEALLKMRDFRMSAGFAGMIEEANSIDPAVGELDLFVFSMIPPLHDEDFGGFLAVLRELPVEGCDALVLMPFGKLGGADFVAGVLTGGLADMGMRPLVLRTELSDWERPDWFPEDVPSVDISARIAALPGHIRQRALYEVIRHLTPKIVVNVNSRLAFDTFDGFGARLKLFTQLYCYYFCADRTPQGNEAGYPVSYFAPLLPNLAGALIDTENLAETLVRRHTLPGELAARVHVLPTPAMQVWDRGVLADLQVEAAPERDRPTILWAGRFDRQKRFDLLVEIARAMPTVQFRCWGKAVLDAPPDLSTLPPNIEVHPPFIDYGDLPLENCDCWLYTSAWDGMPTILIEIARMGMPVVASAVGGILELVDESTGWPVPPEAEAVDYVRVIEYMLSEPAERQRRARALQARATDRHSRTAYLTRLRKILGWGEIDDGKSDGNQSSKQAEARHA